MRILTIILALLCWLLPANAQEPKHEMRGVWVATVWGIDWPSKQGNSAKITSQQIQELETLLDRCADMNLTTVIFQVRSMADAMYDSPREPWSRFLTGRRNLAPSWDPLQWMVTECHARGLECYAWVNPLRTIAENENFSGDAVITFGNYTALNPGLESVRQHVVEVCRDIVSGYEIDGLIFDDYFYPNRIPADTSAPDYDLYAASGKLMSFSDWRRANIHKLVADVKAMIFDERPDVRFGISPAGVAGRADTSAKKWGLTPVEVKAADWQWNEIFSDPAAWLYQGTVDFVSPQLYWPTTHERAPFIPLSQWWDYAAMRYGRNSYPSISLADLEKSADAAAVADHIKQIAQCRRHSSPGVIFYSAKNLPKIAPALRQASMMTSKSISPEATGKYPHNYPAVTGLRRKRDMLQWDAVKPSHPGAIVRYAVYAFPAGIDPDEITAEGVGIDSRYLLRLCYGTEFPIPEEYKTRMSYAVTVVDGNSVEHTPSIIR